MNDIYFTADLHLGHENLVTKISDRPFKSIEEHDEVLIENWNKVVTGSDRVYILGDFAWRDIHKYAKALNGNKHLILGNHDRVRAIKNEKTGVFDWAGDYKYLKVGNQKLALFHYPMRSWQGKHHGTWHLYGHVHASYIPIQGSLDVGVDVPFLDYTPISFETLAAYFKDEPSYGEKTDVYRDRYIINTGDKPCNEHNCSCGRKQ